MTWLHKTEFNIQGGDWCLKRILRGFWGSIQM